MVLSNWLPVPPIFCVQHEHWRLGGAWGFVYGVLQAVQAVPYRIIHNHFLDNAQEIAKLEPSYVQNVRLVSHTARCNTLILWHSTVSFLLWVQNGNCEYECRNFFDYFNAACCTSANMYRHGAVVHFLLVYPVLLHKKLYPWNWTSVFSKTLPWRHLNCKLTAVNLCICLALHDYVVVQHLQWYLTAFKHCKESSGVAFSLLHMWTYILTQW